MKKTHNAKHPVSYKRVPVLAVFGLLTALTLTGCVSDAGGRLNEVKDGLATSVSGLKTWAGDSVQSIEQVNSGLVQASAGVIKLLETLDFDLQFQENGIAFTNASGISGVVGVSGNQLVLDVASETTSAAAVKTIIRISTVFSGNAMVEEKINAFIGSEQVQEVQLDGGGYIRTDGTKLEVRLITNLV